MLGQQLKSNDSLRATPLQNAKVEQGFKSVNRDRTMLVAANIPENRRYLFAREVFKTTTKADDLCVVEYEGETKCRD